MRKDSTPLVYTVEGMAGRDVRTADKRLAEPLAEKLQREYLKMVYFVRARYP